MTEESNLGTKVLDKIFNDTTPVEYRGVATIVFSQNILAMYVKTKVVPRYMKKLAKDKKSLLITTEYSDIEDYEAAFSMDRSYNVNTEIGVPTKCNECSGTNIQLYMPYHEIGSLIHWDSSKVYLCRDCYNVVKIKKGSVLKTTPGYDDLPF